MIREPQLSDLQLAILRILWDRGQATAAEVRDALNQRKPLALTTVSTMLSRLAKRGLVGHERQGRQFTYHPLVDEENVRQSDVSDLTRRWFEGDPTALVSHLLDARDIDDDDLNRIRKLLATRTNQRGRKGRQRD